VVIFPFAEEFYSLSPKSTVWMETDSETIGLPKFLIKESSSMSDWGDEGATKIARLSEEHLLDNINILYVALTRPVEQLYVISSMNLDKSGLPKKNTMSGFFIAFLQQQGVFAASKLDYTFGTAQKMSETKIVISNVKEIEKLTAFLPMDAIKIAQRETLMWDSSQQEAVDFGNLIHEIMANIQTSADVSNALQKATLAGLITPDQWNVFEQKINAILQHELLQSFFQTEAKVINEQTILTPEGHFIKPDRLVQINENEMMLLDYKTGKPLLTHQNQILNYAKIVEAMGFQVVQKTLVYIDEMNIEVVEVG
jgi:ATP-dependent exoDNAse (exonuclease V) beta subunit